jgi:tripartite-type tricarboxylate transporter receptor subunit TctC
LARFLGRHIPGNPAIVIENMPGAGHVLAANYMYNEAPRDGTTIETTLPSIITHQLLDGRGVRYDVGKFQFLGSDDVDNQNVYVWAASGVHSIDDARSRTVTMGATGAGSYTLLYPRLMNSLLGTRFKVVSGYPQAAQIDLALEHGEVEGRAGDYFSTLEVVHPDWLRNKTINIIAQIGLQRDPNYPNVPMLADYVKSDESAGILQLFASEAAAGHPFLAPPGTAPERLSILRTAFEQTMRDADYLSAARKMGMKSTWISASALAGMISKVMSASPQVVEAARRIKDDESPASQKGSP